MQFEDADLSDLLGETQRAVSLETAFPDQIVIQGADTPVSFRADPNRIIQVLTNLLGNARKFSSAHGRIVMRVEQQPDFFRISAQAEGRGIPAKDQYKVFQCFADLENSDKVSKGGTGLDLNICKAIVENMGSTIGFHSPEGIGTTFYFTLPRPPSAPLANDQPSDYSTLS